VKGKHSPGNGLGLAFVDAVAQAHGGTVKISGHPGGGATVSLLLPVSEMTLPTSFLKVPVRS
jgi:signal transduction histidine kinase